MKVEFLLFTLLLGVIPSMSSGAKAQITDEEALEKIVFTTNAFKELSTDGEVKTENNLSISVKLNYDAFSFEEYDENGEEDVDTYRARLFQAGKAYHQKHNREVMRLVDTSDIQDIYVSKYTPFFSYDVPNQDITEETYDSIVELAHYGVVEEITVGEDCQYEPCLSNAMSAINVKPYVDAGTYTGEGIVVGVLEPSILDKNHSNFANTNVIVRDEWYYIETVDDHTTQVGSIIAGKYGIAPGVTLLSVELAGNAQSEVDWMMDQGVHIINCSYGDANPTGVYSADSAYMDYIAYTYNLTIIAAAGNDGNDSDYIGNPGLGYNVLTVGASYTSTNTKPSFSSSKTSGCSTKPNLIAPGVALNVFPFATCTGTSFAAPIVSGCAALLMQAKSIAKLRPDLVFALMSANTDAVAGTPTYSLQEGIGTGRLNFGAMMQNLNRYFFYSFNTTATEHTFSISLSAGQKVRISVAWLALATGKVNGTSLTDYDLYLEDTSNNMLNASVKTYNNVEFVEYTVSSAGTYIIRVQQYGTRYKNDMMTVAYRIV